MTDYTESPIADLVAKFESACLQQDDTFISGDTEAHNKLYKVIDKISRELARRPSDGRRSLLALLTHKNPNVRLQAALFAYPVAPAQAKACLRAIASARLPDQSLAAGMALSRLQDDPHCLD